MRNKRKAIAALLLALLLAVPLGTGALAANTVDPENDTGTLSLTLQSKAGSKVSGVEVTLYQVGTGAISNSNLRFSLVEALSKAQAPLEGLTAEQNQKSAAALRSFINGMEDQSTLPLVKKAQTDKAGHVEFTDLPVGMYLVVQTSRSSRFYDVTPFLVSLPMTSEDGSSWVFAVDASPKVQLRPSNPPPTDPEDPVPPPVDPVTPPVDPDQPNPPVDIDDPDVPGGDDPGLPDEGPGDEIEVIDPDVPLGTLPETGMVQWPISVLAILGLTLFAMGWNSERNRRREQGR